MTYPLHIRQAAARAANWLETNPDRHIVGDLAVNRDGEPVFPTTDAFCFCALGRLAAELDLQPDKDNVGYEALLEAGLSQRDKESIYIANDDIGTDEPAAAPDSFRAGAGGVAILRRLAQNGDLS